MKPSWNTGASEFVPGQFSLSPRPVVVQPPKPTNQTTTTTTTTTTATTVPTTTTATTNTTTPTPGPPKQQNPKPTDPPKPTTPPTDTWEDQDPTPPSPPSQQTPPIKESTETIQKPIWNQNTKPANPAPPPPETEEGDEEELEEGVAGLTIADDPREHINVVFIGHVDAGKSTISGNILYLTGQVDSRTIEKYEREAKDKNRTSWFLAYIMDTNDEERLKGITVEVGRAHFATDKKRYTILDTPGHKNYVPNMISGVAQADIAVLVISARKGEFEAGFDRSGQTREHALLAKTLGVKKIVIAINKMDEPTVCWSEERYNSIKKSFSEWLTRERVYPLKDVEWIPISGFDGSNIMKPVEPKICPWYQGQPLLGVLDSLQPLSRMDAAPLRIPVLDRYKDAGKLVILGKIEAGILKTGDVLQVHPGGNSFTVFQIQNDAGILTVACPGENVRLIIRGGLEEENIWRGAILSHSDKPPHITSDFVAQIQLLDLLEHKSLFCAGYECVLHIHTAVEDINVKLLLEKLNAKTGKTEQKLPKFVQSKDIIIAHLTTPRPVAMEKFDEFAQLGRFTLRDEGKTIALGKILATNAPIRRKKQ